VEAEKAPLKCRPVSKCTLTLIQSFHGLICWWKCGRICQKDGLWL